MTEHDALLAAVLASPADDLPRLVLADWYEENGQVERAEFVRVQCALARWTDPLKCPQCGEGYDYSYEMDGHAEGGGFKPSAELGCVNDHFWKYGDIESMRKRERRLWLSHKEKWFGKEPIGLCLESDVVPTEYPLGIVRRGFADELHCRLANWCGGQCPAACVNHATYGRAVYDHAGPDSAWVQCPECSGEGRTLGIGPKVIMAHPIEYVHFTDVEPEHILGTTENCSWANLRGVVSAEMFDWIYPIGLKWHLNANQARRYLSDRVIRWAKNWSATRG